jgi:hypothetical protein
MSQRIQGASEARNPRNGFSMVPQMGKRPAETCFGETYQLLTPEQ